jgi:hypothetical protein
MNNINYTLSVKIFYRCPECGSDNIKGGSMIEDEEIPLIDVTATIGGDLPEKELKTFIHTVAYMLYQESYQGNQLKNYTNHIEGMISSKIRTLDCASLDLQIKAQDGQINGAFTMYCVHNKLSTNVRSAPFIDSNGNYRNEAVTLYRPGQTHLTVVPTDGEANPTTLKEIYMELKFKEIAQIATLCEQFLKLTSMLKVALDNENLSDKIVKKLQDLYDRIITIKQPSDVHYLLKIIGDVEPELVGPFENTVHRTDKAKEHRRDDPDKNDGLFMLDMRKGEPTVNSYSGKNLDI